MNNVLTCVLQAVIFDEIDLTDLTFAECSIKNVNHSFQVITPFRRLVLCAESRREMEDWIQALKAASNREYYEAGDHHEFLSGHHHWYATSHARPTYCNVCREALSGVTSHGLSCEVCKCKVHKRCAAKAISNCKWTTLASIGKDIIEDEDGVRGHLTILVRLQDWRCLWCRATVHTACRPLHPKCCPLGPCRVSVVPPTALHSIGNDEAWEAVRPQGCSPLLVFVNSKSGDNQGVKFLRRFKQLLNPAQVFDLISNGPGLGLRLFRHFDPFRILVCSGDGSVGWVLSEIDRLNLHKQCQVGVLPLGTGNDLARVLGWGSSCDDDTHLPQLLEKYEKACTKMLDRLRLFRHFDPFRILVCSGDGSVGWKEVESLDEGEEKSTFDKPEKDLTSIQELKKTEFVQRDALMSRANSLKKAIRQLVEHTEQAVDEQNKTTVARAGPKVSPCPSPLSHSPSPDLTARLTAISPLPDLRRDSGCSEDMLTLPVPVEFADEEARRRSLVPSEDEDGFCPSETAIPVPSPAKHMKRFLSLPDDDVLTGTIPSSNIEDRRIFPSKDEKDKGNLAAQVESVQSVEIGISVSCEDALLPPQDVQDDETPPMDLLVISDSQETRRSSTVSLKDMEKDICHIDSPETTEVDPTNDQEDEIPADEEVGISGLHIRTIEGLLQPPDDGAVNLQSELAAAGFEDTGKMILTPSSPEDEVLTPVTPEEKSDSDEEVGELVKGCSLAHFEEGNDIARRSFYKQIKGGAGRKKKSATDKSLTVQHSEALTEQDNEYLGVYKIRIQGSNNNLSAEAASTPGSALTSHRPSLAASEGDDDELLHVIVNPPSPVLSDEGMPDPMRRDSVDSTSKLSVTSPTSGLHCSPAATRRISSGSLLKAPDAVIAAASAQQAGSARDRSKSLEKDNRFEEKIPAKRLPIINPLVRLPMWPNVSGGAGLVSKVLLANADALCAAASPLMDPDETLLEGYYERAVMNNYFGIGIDAKISLDFHQKREEHPEKCRSRAKNYMWYGVLGSKEWLQDSLASIAYIASKNHFMGGTNFWGGTKEDDCFLAPSFDDRVLEVVAVFGSVQMAASRLINLQHHRIAQCQTTSLRAWEEKQRHQQALSHSQSSLGGTKTPLMSPFSEEENQLLLSFIESVTTLIKPQVTELVTSARQLYEETCILLREKAQNLGCSERKGRARGLFWLKFRRGERGGGSRSARDVATWGVAEVATWLETLQLSEYAESFTRHDIRGRELLTLGRRDLKELGVTKVGHVKRILQAVRDLTM
ncbi:hypothetical protein C0J52_19377 [Blattella germanica]|nr:hypothetical protein C0J52_19377 [Blattella germanica]